MLVDTFRLQLNPAGTGTDTPIRISQEQHTSHVAALGTAPAVHRPSRPAGKSTEVVRCSVANASAGPYKPSLNRSAQGGRDAYLRGIGELENTRWL